MIVDYIGVTTQDGYKNLLDTNIYITKTSSGLRHINAPRKPGCCPVCGKHTKNMGSHHVIPKRVMQRKGELGELRIRICSECHSKIHLENYLAKLMKQMVTIIEDVAKEEVSKIDTWKKIKETLKQISDKVKKEGA